MNRTKVICFANQKGGCGKTTMANEFAAGLKRRGYAVLVIDMDPQGDISDCSRADHTNAYMIDDVLYGKISAEEAVQKCPNYDIIAANQNLVSVELKLAFDFRGEDTLKNAIRKIKNGYDFVVIDTAPQLSTLNYNVLVASDEVIIPILPDIYAIHGIRTMSEMIEKIRPANPDIKVDGIVFTQFDSRTNSSQTLTEITRLALEELEYRSYRTRIRKAVAVEEARTDCMTMYEYSRSKGKKAQVKEDFESFVDEYLEEIKAYEKKD